jgi:dipeptidyl aminopeptidase/acylaminoacyl peptidase
MQVKQIEGLTFEAESCEFEKDLAGFIPSINKETIRLENGAEATFTFSTKEEFSTQKRPLVLVIHGGPFGYGPQDIFL